MGNFFSAPTPRDDHKISTHEAIERRMITHNTHGNVASKGVKRRAREAKEHRRRGRQPSRNRAVFAQAHHAPKGAIQPPHRRRRNAAHHAQHQIPSAKKMHKREMALKAADFASDVAQAAFANKLMFGF